ncbi:MAG: YlmH/Sll1252 family protein, partial [Oscillospiraceae bacterium]
MGPKEKIERLAQTPEDRVLLARVWERLSAGQRREIPAFSCFLSLREQELVRRLMGEETLTFFGGYPEAERAVACYLPPYLEENSLYAEGPVTCICASYFEGDCLTHRDFLGSLMGAGIKRETVGDICVGKGSCDFFLLREMAPYVVQNLPSAGRTRLHLEEIPLEEAQIPTPETETIRGT